MKGLASESSRRRRRIAKNLHRGIRGCFCVRSPEIAIRGGNYAQAGARDIRCKARGVTPSRNVIGWTEVIAKLGRTVAAGSGTSGARGKVPLVFEMPQSGSGPQVGVGGSPARMLQGSGSLVCVFTGGAGHKATTKAGTGFSRFDNVPAAGELNPRAAGPWRGVYAA
jgi:hypothetical protein